MPAIQPLPHDPSQPRPNASPRVGAFISAAALAADLVTVLGLGMVTLFIRPRAMETFEAMDVELPRLTQLVVAVPAWPIAAALLLLAILLVAKEDLILNKRVTLAINLAVVPLLGVAVFLLILGLYLPLVHRTSLS